MGVKGNRCRCVELCSNCKATITSAACHTNASHSGDEPSNCIDLPDPVLATVSNVDGPILVQNDASRVQQSSGGGWGVVADKGLCANACNCADVVGDAACNSTA